MHSLSTIASAPRWVGVSKVLQLAAALFLGAVVLYGAGFVQSSPVHNAAHDMRHSQGFPCH
jgi:cobalt transporter subunit CbtB